jgi:hypothetical protein
MMFRLPLLAQRRTVAPLGLLSDCPPTHIEIVAQALAYLHVSECFPWILSSTCTCPNTPMNSLLALLVF